jgi:hypothetical protein
VRIPSLSAIAIALLAVSCVKVPEAGVIADGSTLQPKIIAVDTSHPPRSATIQLDRPGYLALLLVAPGHSVTLLYPRDSATNNQRGPGAHQITFQIPSALVLSDTALANRPRLRDSTGGGRQRTRTVTSPPIDPTMASFFLLLTSPQRLDYARMVERTLGVSLPTIETEALNATAKAIKATITTEPRELAGYYQRVELGRIR